MHGVEDEIERLDHILLAAENWAKGYEKSPDTHAKLIKADTRLERKLRKYFKALSKQHNLINQSAYSQTVHAATVEVIVNQIALNEAAGILSSIFIDEIIFMVALGAQAGEDIYKIPLGISTSDSIIQDIALNHTADLVKGVTQTIKNDISSSIATSIHLGENIDDAVTRLGSVIDNPKRAETIARTETVNSYSMGLKEFGKQSGAVGKEWQDNDAVDVCADNADQGIIDLNDEFTSGDDVPAAHPNCRCTIRMVYQNELDNA